jgi:hypothetical protein
LKAETFAVLQAHPYFAKWTNSYRPNANFDLAAYVFMRSSTWPDEIRRSSHKYDHPNWHFIDYPSPTRGLLQQSSRRRKANAEILKVETDVSDRRGNLPKVFPDGGQEAGHGILPCRPPGCDLFPQADFDVHDGP